MDDVQAAPNDDPKPVFDGDWNSATGVEKGQHSERVRQWRRRQAAKAGGPMAAGSVQPLQRLRPGDAAAVPAAPEADPTNLVVLRAIRDDPNALASDRIRATQQLLQAERGADAGTAHDSDLVQLRAVLEALQPEERLAWLQGERLEHASVGGAA